MKILLVTRMIYVLSLAEKVMHTLAEQLGQAGHQVYYFSVDADENPRDIKNAYVVQLPGGAGLPSGLPNVHKRYNTDVAKHLFKFLEAVHPDMAIVFRIDGLTGSVIEMLYKNSIPTFRFLPDFYPACVNGSFADLRKNVCSRSVQLDREIAERKNGLKHGSKKSKKRNDGNNNTLENADSIYRRNRRLNCFSQFNCLRCVQKKCIHQSYGDTFRTLSHIRWQKSVGLFDHVDGYIVSSQRQKELLEMSLLTTKPILNLSFPLPNEAFDPVQTRRGGYFLYIGTVQERKGVRTLLTAMSQCVSTEAVKIIGGGKDLKPLREMAQTQMLNVQFFGKPSLHMLSHQLQGCTALIVPSECEQVLPLVLLQAQAMGKPVIASDMGVLPERVQNKRNGLIFPAGNSLALAQTMDFMHNMPDEEYNAMCRNARQDALNRYRADDYAQKIVELYDFAIERRTGRKTANPSS